MSEIRVKINKELNEISVYNDGVGIPVEFHNTENMYVAELIFGQLLTGSNYDDNQQKIVGGRNGFGAKLANVFSTYFKVECGDTKNKKKLIKEWSHNMS